MLANGKEKAQAVATPTLQKSKSGNGIRAVRIFCAVGRLRSQNALIRCCKRHLPKVFFSSRATSKNHLFLPVQAQHQSPVLTRYLPAALAPQHSR